MNRGVLLAVLGLICFGAGGAMAKLHTRYQMARCSGVSCAHLEIRMKAIESHIRQAAGRATYLALGDSFVELADMPEICGRKPINAGIGGAKVATFAEHGPRLARLAQPDFVAVSLGANDATAQPGATFQSDMKRLVSSLGPRVIVLPLPPGRNIPFAAARNEELAKVGGILAAPMISAETTADGIHLTAHDYEAWKSSLETAAHKLLICPEP